MMAKIEVFTNYTDDVQRNVGELVDWFSNHIKGRDIGQATIIFRDEEDELCFVAGSRDRDMCMPDLSYDLGQALILILLENYEKSHR